MKKRLMIFCDSYLPGHLGGGGMWAVRNIALRFCDRYDFFIVTRDCDGKLDRTPYVKIARNKWTIRDDARVYYASPSNLNSQVFTKLVAEIEPDAIYLNSIFSKVCSRFLFARRAFRERDIPLLIAPCGELAEAALAINGVNKRVFIFAAKSLGLFHNVIWKASSTAESRDVQRVISSEIRLKVAPELTPKDIFPNFTSGHKPGKSPGYVRLVYLSRVTRKKNLHFLLEILTELEQGAVDLDVIGPTDDEKYLNKCRQIAASLPTNVRVSFIGGIDHNAALSRVRECHFLVLPTGNENFGYVVIESLAAGCPVLVSDEVPWNAISECNAGWRISLEERSEWLAQLNRCVLMDALEYGAMSFSAREFAVRYMNADEPIAANQLMFDSVLSVPYVNG